MDFDSIKGSKQLNFWSLTLSWLSLPWNRVKSRRWLPTVFLFLTQLNSNHYRSRWQSKCVKSYRSLYKFLKLENIDRYLYSVYHPAPGELLFSVFHSDRSLSATNLFHRWQKRYVLWKNAKWWRKYQTKTIEANVVFIQRRFSTAASTQRNELRFSYCIVLLYKELVLILNCKFSKLFSLEIKV